jgi:hypothetical protein
MLFRAGKDERCGLTYREYALEILERGRATSSRSTRPASPRSRGRPQGTAGGRAL